MSLKVQSSRQIAANPYKKAKEKEPSDALINHSTGSMKPEYDYLFKVVLLGDSGVGKSSLILRFADDTYNNNFMSTIGVDFKIRTIELKKKEIKFQIWDTAGQEKFRTIGSQYDRGFHAYILCFDVTDRVSFNNLRSWQTQVEKDRLNKPIFFISANKSDEVKKQVVETADVEKYATEIDAPFIFTSAKEDKNVEELFNAVGNSLLDHIEKENLIERVKPGIIYDIRERRKTILSSLEGGMMNQLFVDKEKNKEDWQTLGELSDQIMTGKIKSKQELADFRTRHPAFERGIISLNRNLLNKIADILP